MSNINRMELNLVISNLLTFSINQNGHSSSFQASNLDSTKQFNHNITSIKIMVLFSVMWIAFTMMLTNVYPIQLSSSPIQIWHTPSLVFCIFKINVTLCV